MRSEFMRRLILEKPEPDSVPCEIPSNIPKVLVRFWHDHTELPDDVAECLDSWRDLSRSEFQILTFDDESAVSFIETTWGKPQTDAFRRCRHPAMRSDYFRLCYILASGGFYVDADDVLMNWDWSTLYADDQLKLHPLCYDIPSGCMVPTSELYRSDTPEPDRIFYVNNNPLVAPPGHPLIRRALERATAALLETDVLGEIQSTTGPGNLTAALAAHARELALRGQPRDFVLLRDWDKVARTRWELSYRSDGRNWRNIGAGEVCLGSSDEAGAR